MIQCSIMEFFSFSRDNNLTSQNGKPKPKQKPCKIVPVTRCDCGCESLKNKCLFKKLKKRNQPKKFINILLLTGIYASALDIDKYEITLILNKLRRGLIMDSEWLKKKGKRKGKIYLTNLEAKQNVNLHFNEIMQIMHIAKYLSKKIDKRLAFVFALNIIYGMFILEATMLDMDTSEFHHLYTQYGIRHKETPLRLTEYNKKYFEYSLDPVIGKILYSP